MSCFTEVHTCSSYENDFICSENYCFESPIDPDAGIPAGAKPSVSGKNIEIDGVYYITKTVAFINCNFKMHPGASIRIAPVSAGVTTIVFKGCKFFGCGDMWYGITVDASSTDGLNFNFTGCTLEDAAVGLTLDEGRENRYTIADNAFFNNHLCITNMQQNDLLLNAAIVRNSFYSTDTLAAATLTLQGLMAYYPRAFAGIELIRTTASIGSAPALSHSNENEFYCMIMGLREAASSVGSAESYFHDLDSGFGSGVSAVGGSVSIDVNRFESAGSTALNADGVNLEVFNSEFGGRSSIGINSTGNLNGEQVDIMENNSFDINDASWTQGIWLTRSQASGAALHNRILDNQFEVGEEVLGLSAITVLDQVTATDELQIRNNTITANQGSPGGMDGISLNIFNSNNFKVTNNTILYSNPAPNSSFGIYLRSLGMVSTGHSIIGNTITGESNDALQCSIHAIEAYNMDFCENEVDYSQWGLHFNGANSVSLRENKIKHHVKGMIVGSPTTSTNASITPQIGRGNTWSALTLDPDDCEEHSIFLNTSGNPLLSKILVQESDDMPFLPPENKIFPNSMSIPPSIWVAYDPNVPTDYCDPEEYDQPLIAVTPFEREIILDTSALTDAALWDAQRKVYAKLLHNPGLRPSSSDEETFFNNLAGSAIDSFAQVEQLVMDALEMTAGDQQVLDSCRQVISQALDSLAVMDTLVNTFNTDTLPYTYFSDRADLLETVMAHKLSEDTLEYDRYQQIETGLAAALALNAAIAGTQTWEAARQTFNELYIRRLLREPLTDTFYTRILDLAGEDPEVAGAAASDATVLLAPCDFDAFREPEGESEAKPLGVKTASKSQAAIKVFPNPTAGNIQVALPSSFTGSVTVLNIHGRQIASALAEKAGSSVVFQLENLWPGLYWVTLIDSAGRNIGSSKFALIR